ncbi:magnesium transporter NIPA-domain-containing protein [Lactarius akahatsu]|uniref:Magnesium transporter NIPA-domain-containing protein n=1 Tax=Lactarius akahatsu TaxID=416441 RepID=A0AAD4LFX2_9AGAM|nr:magnesium transporter NIPA-domain-containing protein [Lactarius akahatsu]
MSSSTPSPSPSAKSFQAPSSLKVILLYHLRLLQLIYCLHTTQVVGIILAVLSGVLIGSSFVLKKKGLLRSQAGHTAGEGVAYLKSVLWWSGMIMMILGELCNFTAYAFVEALVVTPLGALSVVISAALSSIFLNEKLTFFGWLGCALCIIGSTIIALNGKLATSFEASVGQIVEFQHLFLSPLFVVYASLLIAGALSIIFYFGPRYGDKNMIWYILVCSLIGGLSVSVTTGLGSAIVTTVMGDNQFKHWFIYFLLVFIAVTLVTEVFYLNKALALFNTAMVTPTYYVIFSFCSMVTTVVLFKGLKASASQIITIVMAFLVICVGITILQMSKVDPTEFKKLDRRSTILLQAARKQTEAVEEKSVTSVEDPGIDALRGSFGTVGSIIRARSARRISQASRNSAHSSRFAASGPRLDVERGDSRRFPGAAAASTDHYGAMQRHQLFDPPVPHLGDPDSISMASHPSMRTPAIKFGEEDVVHSYRRDTAGKDDLATHERRLAPHNSSPLASPRSLEQPSLSSPENAEGDLLRQLSSPTNPKPGHPLRYDPAVEGLRTAPPRIGIPVETYYDPFEGSPATVTVPSFPSEPLPDGEPARRHHRRFSRQGSSRDYPKGNNPDDEEESVSLWDPRRDTNSEEADAVASPDSPIGTIRLVNSSRPGRF